MKTQDAGFPDKLDDTYFTATDCEPTIKGDGTIEYYDGHGSRRRSWGTPQVTTTIVVDEHDFLALHVGFSHKHRGGQFWRYYVEVEGQIARRLWGQLTDDERQIVLDNGGKAPRWAKSPGKLRAEYVRPEMQKFDGYKILRLTGPDTFESLYDRTTWTLGKRNGEAVAEDAGSYIESYDEYGQFYPAYTTHGGGFYVHPDIDKLLALWKQGKLVPDRCLRTDTYALVRCECSGRVRAFSSGKLAVTYCKPVEIVKAFEL